MATNGPLAKARLLGGVITPQNDGKRYQYRGGEVKIERMHETHGHASHESHIDFDHRWDGVHLLQTHEKRLKTLDELSGTDITIQLWGCMIEGTWLDRDMQTVTITEPTNATLRLYGRWGPDGATDLFARLQTSSTVCWSPNVGYTSVFPSRRKPRKLFREDVIDGKLPQILHPREIIRGAVSVGIALRQWVRKPHK